MKRFVRKTLIMTIPLVCLFAYYNLCVSPHMNGDLGRLGMMTFDDGYDTLLDAAAMDSLYVTEIESLDQIDTDSAVLTVGDSFSQQGIYGYQNYLASLFPGCKVYNLNPEVVSHDQTYQYILDLIIDNGTLPKYVVMESVERHLIERLANFRFSPSGASQRQAAYLDALKNVTPEAPSTLPGGIRAAKDMIRDFRDRILQTQEYAKKALDINNPVKHLSLKEDLFSCKGREHDLYFYRDDLNVPSGEKTQLARRKLDSLLHLVGSSDIRFVFLVASNKYHLYRQFSESDPFGASGNLEHFTTYGGNPYFINSQELLGKHVARGEKDIYRCNDTHWNTKAAKYVAEEIKRKLQEQTR